MRSTSAGDQFAFLLSRTFALPGGECGLANFYD
jgi:hypothetical protein